MHPGSPARFVGDVRESAFAGDGWVGPRGDGYVLRRFTTIARPYVFEDLQRAVAGIVETLHATTSNDPDAAERAIEPLRDAMRSLANGSFDHESLSELRRSLRDLDYIADPDGSSGLRRRLLRIAQALLEWPEKTGGTVLWTSNLHLGEVDASPILRAHVDHPRTACYTLPIKKSEDAFWIASESYWQSFRSNRPTNVLYLDDPELRGCDAIEFVFGQQRFRARYRRMRLDEAPLSFPASRFHERSELAGVLFKEAGIQAQAHDDAGTTRDVYLAAKSDDQEFAAYPTVGWLNPLVMTFDTDGDDIASPEQELADRARSAIRLYSTPELVLACEPHIESAESLRAQALQALADRHRDERRWTSTVERLLWGGDGTHPWRAYFVLDQLGGTFVIAGSERQRNHGDVPGRRSQRFEIAWRPPADQLGNAAWLENLILAEATHYVTDDRLVMPERVLPPSVVAGVGSRHGYRRLHLASRLLDDRPMVLTLLTSLLEKPQHVGADRHLDGMLRFARDLLERIHGDHSATETPSSRPEPYFGEGSFQRVDEDTVLFNEVSFLEGFARHYLAPRSPVYALLPPLEDEMAAVDIVRSVPLGNKEFYRRLIAAAEAPSAGFVAAARPEEDGVACYEVAYRYGWWQEWFDALFFLPDSAELQFVADREGFVLIRSKLAGARLGRATIGNRFDVEHMRI